MLASVINWGAAGLATGEAGQKASCKELPRLSPKRAKMERKRERGERGGRREENERPEKREEMEGAGRRWPHETWGWHA